LVCTFGPKQSKDTLLLLLFLLLVVIAFFFFFAVSGPRKGLQWSAMALIGARTDANGRRWFPLKNWWPEKQFAEVSDSYLVSRDRVLYFFFL
jgi:hypothetical protein